jgi:hypothetical protein
MIWRLAGMTWLPEAGRWSVLEAVLYWKLDA